MATPTISLTGGSSITEGSSGTQYVSYTVRLSSATTSAVKVVYSTTNGTATSGSDYGSTKGTLTIAAGATTGTIKVPVYGDTTYESGETFVVKLTSATNGTLSRRKAVTTTINNDDTASAASNRSEPSGMISAPSETLNVVTSSSLSATPSDSPSAMMAPLFDSAMQALSQAPTSEAFSLSSGESSYDLDAGTVMGRAASLSWGITS